MEKEPFEEAARRYGNTVYRVACHALGDRAEAEDVPQTVLLRLYQHSGGFESEEHQKRWLLRVAVNESRKVLRSPWRKRMIPPGGVGRSGGRSPRKWSAGGGDGAGCQIPAAGLSVLL